MQKRRCFSSFHLTVKSEEKHLTEWNGVLDDRSSVLNGSFLWGFPAHTRNIDNVTVKQCCKYTTSVAIQKTCYKQLVTHVELHASAVSLLESGESINNNNNLNIWAWAKRRRRRVEIKQLREVWKSCTRDNVEAGESYFVLNPSADQKLMETKE